LLVMPYLIALLPQKFAALPLPLLLVLVIQALQAGLLCWLLAWFGPRLGAPYGLDTPWLRACVYRRQRSPAYPYH
ncbi:MAG: type II CAAX prenyl endopeptidase Rce1 family protein, partial [Rhodanobacter sp.]